MSSPIADHKNSCASTVASADPIPSTTIESEDSSFHRKGQKTTKNINKKTCKRRKLVADTLLPRQQALPQIEQGSQRNKVNLRCETVRFQEELNISIPHTANKLPHDFDFGELWYSKEALQSFRTEYSNSCRREIQFYTTKDWAVKKECCLSKTWEDYNKASDSNLASQRRPVPVNAIEILVEIYHACNNDDKGLPSKKQRKELVQCYLQDSIESTIVGLEERLLPITQLRTSRRAALYSAMAKVNKKSSGMSVDELWRRRCLASRRISRFSKVFHNHLAMAHAAACVSMSVPEAMNFTSAQKGIVHNVKAQIVTARKA